MAADITDDTGTFEATDCSWAATAGNPVDDVIPAKPVGGALNSGNVAATERPPA
jgi:hypothetical protein